MNAPRCVVLVPVGTHIDPGCDEALRALERRGCAVRRVGGYAAVDCARNRMATDALADGFDELVWIDADIVFDPDDVDALRAHGLPFVCGLYPKKGPREFAALFPPGTPAVTLGRRGGLTPVVGCGFGFAFTRREVYEAVRAAHALPALDARAGRPVVPYFAPFWAGAGADARYLAEDYAFCERARLAGYPPVADTRVRLWHVGPYRYGWEDAGGELPRFESFTCHLPAPPADPPAAAAAPPAPAPLPGPGPLRVPAAPLPAGFPRPRLYVVTYPANADSLAPTLASLRASDWGEEAVVVSQPADWRPGGEAAAKNYKRALERAAADGCDYAVILEDDVRVGRHFRHNLLANPLVARDACDYLGLFMPDLIAAPWERTEPGLGYRLAKPLYSGPNRLWEKHRVWGAQGYALSRRFVLAALDRWDRLKEGQDTRVIGVCSELQLPLWYAAPCLVEHAPVRSAFGTPAARAADFDAAWRAAAPAGFEPPDGVPGWLTPAEGRALWAAAAGLAVLELGTAGGRATVCLAQSARRVVSVDARDQGPAAEWARRFGVAARVEFRRGEVGGVAAALAGERFGLALVDTEHDAASVRRDLDAVARVLDPGGLVAVHDYPDPGWPDVRRVVDEYAARLGWVRVAQADYLGVFRV